MGDAELSERQTPMLGGVVAAVIGVAGAFMPWVSLGAFSTAGTEGDGALTLVGSVVAGALFFAWGRGMTGGWSPVVAGLIGLGIVFVAVYDGQNVSSAIGELEGNPFAANARVGGGLWATGLAGAGLVVAAMGAFRATMDD